MKITRLSRYFYLKFIRLKGEPHSLAMGTAIGVLVGLTPTMPFHTVIILGITMTTRSSAIAGIISSWIVCNPLTYLPIYYFSMVVGNFVTPYHLNWQRIQHSLNALTSHSSFLDSFHEIAGLGFETIVVMLIGGLVIALPFTIASYYLSLHLFHRIRQRRMKKSIK
jgi:uncharacterized protein